MIKDFTANAENHKVAGGAIMKLRKFSGSGIHGFLKFDFRFKSDLTFLTGINGSGKTTALNAIVGLITPDLTTLATLDYDRIELEFILDEMPVTISAIATETSVQLSLSAVDGILEYNRYVADPSVPPYKQHDLEAEYYREIFSQRATHPVLRTLTTLPTPMFLGLDRRSRLNEEAARFRYNTRTRVRNVFGGSLTTSVMDAATIAEERNRDALIASAHIVEQLQKEMLLNLLSIVPGDGSDFIGIKLPTKTERSEITALRQSLPAIAEILRLSRPEVTARVTPLLNVLEKAANKIPAGATIETVFGPDGNQPQEVTGAVFTWSANQPHLQRIRSASEIADRYNQTRARTLAPIKKYIQLVNDFLRESGKEITFGERGELSVRLEGVDDLRPVSYLSSGEAQIFVILTHLSFNPLVESNNVFIIDEPELSLHVHWQELFVDSIISANPNIQYVLATHSPSIILDRLDKCVDVSGRRGARIKKS